MKKLISFLVVSAVCASFASCGDSKKNNSDTSDKNGTSVSDGDTSYADDEEIVYEDKVFPNDGDAYLAIVDKKWSLEYWGRDEDALAYSAGTVPITGNGDYSVSITTNTYGCREQASGGDPHADIKGEGLSFLAVMIKEGETKYPDAVITVNSVKVDGKEVAMTSKPYTSSDDGKDTRENIFNTWVTTPATDARSTEGPLYESGNPTDFCKDYSALVVNEEDFASWTDIQVDFTVSGIN